MNQTNKYAIITNSFRKSVRHHRSRIDEITRTVWDFLNDYYAQNYIERLNKKGWKFEKIKGGSNAVKIEKFRFNRNFRITLCLKEVNSKRKIPVFLRFDDHDSQLDIKDKDIQKLLSSLDFNPEYDYPILDESRITHLLDEKFEIIRIGDGNFDLLNKFKSSKPVFDTKQFDLIRKNKILLLKGSAGSGKTKILLEKALLNQENKRILYITYNKGLARRAKMYVEEWRKLTHNEFYFDSFPYEDFFMKKTGIGQKNYANFYLFKKWFEGYFGKHRSGPANDVFEVFAEIKGVIKGGFDENGLRRNFSEICPCTKEEISSMINPSSPWSNSESDEKILQSLYSKLQNRNSQYLQFDESENAILQNIRKNQFEYPLMDKDLYLGLNNKRSLFEPGERKILYDVACAYQEFLEKSNLMDENDLARHILLNSPEEDEKYDIVLIDEIQDLSPVQLISLFKYVTRLNGEEIRNIYFVGDFHQMVYPNLYNEGSLKTQLIFHGIPKNHLVLQEMNRNYRVNKKIIQFTNKLVNIRKDKIGSMEDDYTTEIGVVEGEHKPVFMKYTEKDLKDFLLSVKNSTDAWILVLDEADMEYLSRIESDIQKQIFTIQNIKGLENEVIICFNLWTRLQQEFYEILTQDVRKSTRHRLIFNFLYVASTRSRDMLIFLEKEEPEFLKEFFGNELLFSRDYSLIYDRLSASTKEEKYNAAIDLEERGNFDQALLYFEELKNYRRSEIGKIRCQAKKMFYQERKFEKAGDHLANYFDKLNEEEKGFLLECYKNSNIPEKYQIYLLQIDPENDEVQWDYIDRKIIGWIKQEKLHLSHLLNEKVPEDKRNQLFHKIADEMILAKSNRLMQNMERIYHSFEIVKENYNGQN